MTTVSTDPAAPLLVARDGGVCTLTLNRPAALNSFTAAMHALLLPALEAAAADPQVKVVVITGAGRGFCAGQDLNDPAMAGAPEASPDVGGVVERYYRPLANRVRTMPVPVIVMVVPPKTLPWAGDTEVIVAGQLPHWPSTVARSIPSTRPSPLTSPEHCARTPDPTANDATRANRTELKREIMDLLLGGTRHYSTADWRYRGRTNPE